MADFDSNKITERLSHGHFSRYSEYLLAGHSSQYLLETFVSKKTESATGGVL